MEIRVRASVRIVIADTELHVVAARGTRLPRGGDRTARRCIGAGARARSPASRRTRCRRRPTPALPRLLSSPDHHILTIKMSGPMLRRVGEPNTDVIQGTLDMLILKTLSLEPMHGFGIARRIEQVSRGVFKVNPGSLLTALQRLERSGLLDAEWRETENSRRARYYTLTREGKKQLAIETDDWTRRAAAVARLLKAEA